MTGGRPVVADPDLEPVFLGAGTKARPIVVDGAEKLMDDRLALMLQRSSLKEEGVSL
jgi:hypothetical protein